VPARCPAEAPRAIECRVWVTVLFATFAEAVAEGRGKAQAASLRATKAAVETRRLADAFLPLPGVSERELAEAALLASLSDDKAQAHLVGLPHPLFFSQVRDVVAYQRMPEQSHVVAVAYVSDMGAPGASWEDPGATNWIAAGDAVYVVGSGVAGGMGAPGLVPFSRREDAEAFAARHGGQVLTLDAIPDEAVLAPVEAGDAASAEAEADFRRRLETVWSEGGTEP